ncbi:TIGR04283 family arsenosugar biosynthesis glycosyltransferase [uncultured Winogradskyella sp.]|uniref:TIGR04283 family arsenosugar biosynthesis glycosyltransferase n=1 Tax=uncultured Winogradskyella sp. TaxID=395353 RepID=UPI003515D71B
MTKISIIIPIFNECDFIGELLNHLQENSSKENIEDIIVVDGGSTDGSQSIVTKFKDVTLIASEKGRAKQMNTGARKAKGAILYFLHADAFPPKNFDQLIIDEVVQGNKAGCFRMQFDSNHWWLKLASWLTQFNWRPCRGGDQSLFITKALFQDIGGYNEDYIIYEDNILINELYRRRQFVVINKKIKTSARLYKKIGVWRLQYLFIRIYIKRWLGASAEELYTYYKNNIT